MTKRYISTRITPKTKKFLIRKQDNLKSFLGKSVPLTVIIEKMAAKPLFLDDTELNKLKKWRKFK